MDYILYDLEVMVNYKGYNPKPLIYSPKIMVPALGVNFSFVVAKSNSKIVCVIIQSYVKSCT